MNLLTMVHSSSQLMTRQQFDSANHFPSELPPYFHSLGVGLPCSFALSHSLIRSLSHLLTAFAIGVVGAVRSIVEFSHVFALIAC